MNFYEKLSEIKSEVNKNLKKAKELSFEIIEEEILNVCKKNKILCFFEYEPSSEIFIFKFVDYENEDSEYTFYCPKAFLQNMFSAKRYFYQSIFDIPEKHFIKNVYSEEDKKKIKKVADLLPEDRKEKYRQLMKENVEAKEIFYQIAFDFANMNS